MDKLFIVVKSFFADGQLAKKDIILKTANLDKANKDMQTIATNHALDVKDTAYFLDMDLIDYKTEYDSSKALHRYYISYQYSGHTYMYAYIVA